MIQNNSEMIPRARRVGDNFWCLLSLLPYIHTYFIYYSLHFNLSLSLSFGRVTICGVVVVVVVVMNNDKGWLQLAKNDHPSSL